MFTDNPKGKEEWQTAVNLAAFVLTMDSLKQYGLIKTNAVFDTDRAHDLLKRGAILGYFPPDDEPKPLPATPPKRGRGRPRKIRVATPA